MADIPVITVDGPSGTGKGTICGYLANWLGWHFLDSGAIYRVLALAALNRRIALNSEAQLAQLAGSLNVNFTNKPGAVQVLLDGEDVSEAIRREECGNAASKVAALAKVRLALLGRQRAFKKPPGLIADGRDMGTVVFPEADLKLFVTATPEARAERRYKQLIEKGISVNLRALSADISERDARDKARAVSPLKPAPDAVIIDSTGLDVDAVNSRVTELVRKKFREIL